MTSFQYLAGRPGKAPEREAELFRLTGDDVLAWSEGQAGCVVDALDGAWYDDQSCRLTHAVFTGPEDGYVRVFLDGRSTARGSKARLEVDAGAKTQLRLNGRAVCEHEAGCWYRVKKDGTRGAEVFEVVVGPDDAVLRLERPRTIVPTVRARLSALAHRERAGHALAASR